MLAVMVTEELVWKNGNFLQTAKVKQAFRVMLRSLAGFSCLQVALAFLAQMGNKQK
jgi:hypothetical protein